MSFHGLVVSSVESHPNKPRIPFDPKAILCHQHQDKSIYSKLSVMKITQKIFITSIQFLFMNNKPLYSLHPKAQRVFILYLPIEHYINTNLVTINTLES